MVYECTGVFLTRAKITPYFEHLGSKKVVVSAPVKDSPPVLNVVIGCNEVRQLVSGCRLFYATVASHGCTSTPCSNTPCPPLRGGECLLRI